MAKKTYVGISSKSKEIPSIGYVGIPVNGVGKSKRLLKGYIGDANGKAKLFWEITGVKNFWFYFKTVIEQFLWTHLYYRTYSKIQNGFAFYAIFKGSDNGSTFYSPLLISTNADAVKYTTSSGGNFSARGNITINSDTWYWAALDYIVYGTLEPYPTGFEPDCLFSDKIYDCTNGLPSQVLNDILEYIYTNDFAEDYQVRQSYNLVKGNIERTVRKFIAVYLFRYEEWGRGGSHDTAYESICTNFETIVSYFVHKAGSKKIIELCGEIPQGYNGLTIMAFYSNDSLSNVLVDQRENYDGYTYCIGDYEYTPTSGVAVDFMDDGTISYRNLSSLSNRTVDIGVDTTSGNAYMILSNIGLRFNVTSIAYEYNYEDGQTYNIHVGLSIEETIDECYGEWYMRVINYYGNIPSYVQNLIGNWGTIRREILDAIEGISIDATNFNFSISIQSGVSRCQIGARVGDDVFPKQIKIKDLESGAFNTEYYKIDTNSSSPTPPKADYNISTLVYASSYTVGTPSAQSSDMVNIGFYENTTGSNPVNVSLANFGIKKEIQ